MRLINLYNRVNDGIRLSAGVQGIIQLTLREQGRNLNRRNNIWKLNCRKDNGWNLNRWDNTR